MTNARSHEIARSTIDGCAIVVEHPTDRDALLAFSTRRGGVSEPPFDSMNLSIQEGDLRRAVDRNFALLGDALAIDASRIAFCRQVHGDTVFITDRRPDELPSADAVISTRPGLLVGVKTADCLPVLLVDPVHGVAAAIHAGWKGTVLRITRKTLRRMTEEFGSDPAELQAAIGPAIGPCCYEVDDRVLEPFRGSVPDAESFIIRLDRRSIERGVSESRDFRPADSAPRPLAPSRTPEESYRIDLAAANRRELIRLGVPQSNIVDLSHCTACYPELFFSYRRDGRKTGRHVAIAGFRDAS